MSDASVIFRLLIEDEQPEAPAPQPPDDPNQLGLDFNPDTVDPKAEIMRYAEQPFRIQGSSPSDLYQKFEQKLHGRESKKVGKHTYIIRYPDRLAVRFYQTDVVTAFPDGKVVVETGGWWEGGNKRSSSWKTKPGTTTRDRINSWLTSGWHIFKHEHVWYWYNYNADVGMWSDGGDMRYPYSDGDTIYPDGSLQMKEHPICLKRRKKRGA